MHKRILIYALTAATAMVAAAKVSLPAIISDNMVLQQECDARLWGKAAPGETVKILPSWAKTAVSVKTGTDGRWECTVATPKGTSTSYSITFKGSNTVTVHNVLIGEVWLCTGQSNMVFPVGPHPDVLSWQTGMDNYEEQLRDADYKEVRFFEVPFRISNDSACEDCPGGHWRVVNAENAYDCSAIGFLFSRRLHKELNQPIGLVEIFRGGTQAEMWMKSELTSADDPDNADVYKFFEKYNAKAAPELHRAPGGLWNGMVNPVLGYNVRGNIWYQGESNYVNIAQYQRVFTLLIDSWRQEWHNPDMPFYFVQIAPYKQNPVGIREAQFDTWQSGLKNVGMVVTTDCGDSLNIHPGNKVIPAERLVRWALAKTYGRDIPYTGPVYKEMKCTGSAVELTFDYAQSGLTTLDGSPLCGFKVAGPDRIFVDATAVIEGDKIVVSSPNVKHPVAVRYGFEDYIRTNLYNGDGLPASPFRTDHWPIPLTR